jgi:hypothetical protein
LLKVEAAFSPETSVNVYQTTRCHIPEDRSLHRHRCENLRSKTQCLCLFLPKVIFMSVTISTMCSTFTTHLIFLDLIYNLYNIWRRIQIVKLLIMQSPPNPGVLSLSRSKYFPYRPVFKHPQSV